MARKTFDELLLEAVDEALSSLGESAKQSIYFHLQDKFKISRDEIPKRIKEFSEGLERIFGVGARFLEIMIMKRLYAQIGKPLKWNENEEFIFVNYVEAARRSFQRSKAK
ncbi:MAG: hypothetical protein NZ932_05035 [Candidatus Bathyarchaeota archaeon]|nr:hypothetical protein [Candidatus Bathyarchaeota archaeon]MDW8040715.1 hypothetical protein [Nitrososphaerota archaeon]